MSNVSKHSRKSLPPFDAPEPVMRVAGQWLARRDRGFTADEKAAFETWKHASASHAAAVAQLERTMTAFDGLRDLEVPTELSRSPDPDAFAPPRRSHGGFYPLLAATGIAATLAFLLWRAEPPAAPSHWHYATVRGGYERATLADGSRIDLNDDTIVDVEFTLSQRTVRLSRGEAHFQVAKNPARPFVVSANEVAFRAVGTAFNVRLIDSNVEMLVTEGKVQVEPAASDPSLANSHAKPASATGSRLPLLTTGYRIVVPGVRSTPPVIGLMTATEIDRALAWQPHIAEFKKTPLSEVVAEFNRQNRQQIMIADPLLNSLRMGGNFRLDQPDAFVRLLETSFGIAAEHSGDVITLRKAP